MHNSTHSSFVLTFLHGNPILGRGGSSSAIEAEISRDVHSKRFQEIADMKPGDENDLLLLSAQRILVAYANHNGLVGYVHPMSAITALLLRYAPRYIVPCPSDKISSLPAEEETTSIVRPCIPMIAEEDAFWILSALMEDVMPGYLVRDFTEIQVESAVCMRLLQDRLPDVHAHLRLLNAWWIANKCCRRWMSGAFSFLTPMVMARLMDELLLDGISALFRAAIGVFFVLRSDILACVTKEDVLRLLNFGERDYDYVDEVKDKDSNNIFANRILHISDGLLQRVFSVVEMPPAIEVQQQQTKTKEGQLKDSQLHNRDIFSSVNDAWLHRQRGTFIERKSFFCYFL